MLLRARDFTIRADVGASVANWCFVCKCSLGSIKAERPVFPAAHPSQPSAPNARNLRRSVSRTLLLVVSCEPRDCPAALSERMLGTCGTVVPLMGSSFATRNDCVAAS